jgi:hypothetical protein
VEPELIEHFLPSPSKTNKALADNKWSNLEVYFKVNSKVNFTV